MSPDAQQRLVSSYILPVMWQISTKLNIYIPSWLYLVLVGIATGPFLFIYPCLAASRICVYAEYLARSYMLTGSYLKKHLGPIFKYLQNLVDHFLISRAQLH